MRIVVLREIPEASSLLRCWNDLALQMERPQVFYTCEWVLSVQSAFRSAFKPPAKPLLPEAGSCDPERSIEVGAVIVSPYCYAFCNVATSGER